MNSFQKIFIVILITHFNLMYSQKAETLNYRDLKTKTQNFLNKIDSLSNISPLYNKVVTIEIYKTEKNETNIRICGRFEDYGGNELNEHFTGVLIGNTTIPIYKRKNVSINFSKEFEITKKKKNTNTLDVSSDFDMEILAPPPPSSSINYFEIYKLEKEKLEIIEKKFDEVRYDK